MWTPKFPSDASLPNEFAETLERQHRAFRELDELLSSSVVTDHEVRRRLRPCCDELATAASQYARVARKAQDFISDPRVVNGVLTAMLDAGAPSTDCLRQARRDFDAGAAASAEAVLFAQRIAHAAENARWPKEPPEIWTRPLDLPQEYLTHPPIDVLKRAEQHHSRFLIVLREIGRLDLSPEERHRRRSVFIETMIAPTTRIRWSLIVLPVYATACELLGALP